MTIGDLVPWGRRDRDLTSRSEPASGTWRGEMSPFVRLHEEMNRLFDDTFRDFGVGRRGAGVWPHLELQETDDGYRLTAELPGMDEKEIELSYEHGMLTLRGEKKSESKDEGRGYSERRYGMFERRIQVGDVDDQKVTATFDKGVLTVELPKRPEAKAQSKRITINSPTQH